MSTTSDLQKKVDIALFEGEGKILDFELDENGDWFGDEGFDSSITQDVQGYLRATEDEQPVALKRRGSTINENPSPEGWTVGSKVWFYDQCRATIKNNNGSADALRDSLSKYVPEYLQGVSVVGTLERDGIRLHVTMIRKDGKADKRYFDLWDNTGN